MTRRALTDPFVVGPPRAVSTRTRLFPSDVDETVLREVGEHLGSLLRSDLAARCRLGTGPKHLGRAKRKRSLTSRCSSRWAGAITRVVGDMWERELLNLEDLEVRDRREIAELDRRLVLPVGKGTKKKRGYATRSERYQKQRRRQILAARMSATQQRLTEGRVSVVAGGKRLALKRHNLKAAGITKEGWRYQWDAKRMFIAADGEAGKAWGNETIRVAPHRDGEYAVTIRLPAPLAHLSNTPGRTPTYRLSAPAKWHHLAGDWNSPSQLPTGRSATPSATTPDREPLVHHRVVVSATQRKPRHQRGRQVGPVFSDRSQLGTHRRADTRCSRQPDRQAYQGNHSRTGIVSTSPRCPAGSDQPSRQTRPTPGRDGDSHRETQLRRHSHQTTGTPG